MIVIVNYGLGNVKAFANIYHRLGIPFRVADNADTLKSATKVILPGVGAFDHAVQQFTQSGMREVLSDMVLRQHIPVLGVCVGMQMLAEASEEGKLSGLGWIRGVVKKLDSSKLTTRTHLPHMGWNDMTSLVSHPLLCQLEKNANFYFLHSYYFQCHQPENILALTHYGEQFASAVYSDNIYGVQFHPEKSHQCGIQLLKNFADL